MKRQYTKKQIQEAIAYWSSRLRKLDEAATGVLDFTAEL